METVSILTEKIAGASGTGQVFSTRPKVVSICDLPSLQNDAIRIIHHADVVLGLEHWNPKSGTFRNACMRHNGVSGELLAPNALSLPEIGRRRDRAEGFRMHRTAPACAVAPALLLVGCGCTSTGVQRPAGVGPKPIPDDNGTDVFRPDPKSPLKLSDDPSLCLS